jgi:hypothetical protein
LLNFVRILTGLKAIDHLIEFPSEIFTNFVTHFPHPPGETLGVVLVKTGKIRGIG